MSGVADTNHDGVISHDELYRYSRAAGQEDWSHTPHMYAPAGDFRYAGLFGVRSVNTVPAEAPQTGGPERTRVRLVNVTGKLAEAIRSLKQVSVGELNPQLIVEAKDGAVWLYHASGSY